MTRKQKILISACLAFLMGIPFNWIQYKGEEMVSIFQVKELGFQYMFFDLSTLMINAFLIYGLWSVITRMLSKNKLNVNDG